MLFRSNVYGEVVGAVSPISDDGAGFAGRYLIDDSPEVEEKAEEKAETEELASV